MKRTVSIPVDLPSDRFLPLMNQCAEIFNAHIDWSLASRTSNKNKAHKDLYRLLRGQFHEVPSALVQTVRDNALEAVKATKFKRTPRKKPTSGLRYDKRTMTLRGKHIKKTNRYKSRFRCKNCGHKTHADLNAARNIRDDYFLSSTQKTEEQGSVNNPDVSTSFSG